MGTDTPTSAAICTFATPSTANNTIRARCANPAGTDDDLTQLANTGLSPSRKTKAGQEDEPCPNSPNLEIT